MAADQLARQPPDDPTAPRALARIYDDMVHVVTPAASPIRTLAQLRGARVSLGDPDSGVYFIAQRLLEAAGLAPERDMQAVQLGIGASATALADGRIDAFFWSGALPTQGVDRAGRAAADPAGRPGRRGRPAARGAPGVRPGHGARRQLRDPGPGDQPAGAQRAAGRRADCPTTWPRPSPRRCSRPRRSWPGPARAALTIDPRAAIGTQPVLLHPGAEQFYRPHDD